MLSIAPIADDISNNDVLKVVNEALEVGHEQKSEGDYDRFQPDIDLPEYIPESDPWKTEPPAADSDEFFPGDSEGSEPDGPSNPEGGMIDVGGYGPGDDTEPTDPSPYEDPGVDAVLGREARDVFEMLSALKYPLAHSTNATASADAADDDFESVLAETAVLRRELADESHDEGGAVGIAVRDIADELEAESEATSSHEGSLLEISVQMDNTAGRYQAFEVLTLESALVPSTTNNTSRNADSIPCDAPEPSEESSSSSSNVVPRASGDRQRVLGGPSAVESTGTTDDSLSLILPAEDSTKTLWTSAVALMTGGLVVHLLRERTFEHLALRARRAYRRLVRAYVRPKRGALLPQPE